jgi:hypothetical protein
VSEAAPISRREREAYRRVTTRQYRPRVPDQITIRETLRRLSEHPDFQVMLDYFRFLEWERGRLDDLAADTGALLRAAGRRSLLRELERLGERVTDDDRSDQHG